MTRKDYVLIAAALMAGKKTIAATSHDAALCAMQHADCAHAIAFALAQDNPRFDRERFLEAAGVISATMR